MEAQVGAVKLCYDTAMPKISLCMIVRDEAEMLAGCLESAAPAVDEIVVLDTGSTDNTRAIAGDFGATVIPAAWTDFSTARNQVLRRTTGEWVLVLDADEELILETPDRLRELAASDEADAYSLRIINSVEMTEFIDLEKSPQFFMVRFFKHDGAIYLNPIHERLRLPGGSRTARASGVDIIHYGFMLEIFEKRQKAVRNRTMLEQWVKDDGNNPWAHFYLAREEEHDERFHEAADRYKKALPLFIDNNEAAAMVDTYQSLAKCCFRDGQAEEASQTLAQGVLRVPKSVDLRFAYGDLLLEKGYSVYLSEYYPIEKYGVKHTWRSINKYPYKILDDKGWGNYIALRPQDEHLLRRVFRSFDIESSCC